MTSRLFSALNRAGILRGAREDPELYPLAFVMLGAACLMGYHFGGHVHGATPTDERINVVPNSAPWYATEEELQRDKRGGDYKYMYHPYADGRLPPKKSPSALNYVVVEDVTLPRAVHERWNRSEKIPFV